MQKEFLRSLSLCCNFSYLASIFLLLPPFSFIWCYICTLLSVTTQLDVLGHFSMRKKLSSVCFFVLVSQCSWFVLVLNCLQSSRSFSSAFVIVFSQNFLFSILKIF